MDDLKKYNGNITGTITMTKEPDWDTCCFCYIHTYTSNEFMNEPICNLCKEKIITRFKSLINFE